MTIFMGPAGRRVSFTATGVRVQRYMTRKKQNETDRDGMYKMQRKGNKACLETKFYREWTVMGGSRKHNV